MTDASGNATELITWHFVGRIALQFVFLSLVIYLLLNVVVIILYILGMFPTRVQEAGERARLLAMDDAFCASLAAAIKRGEEKEPHAQTGPIDVRKSSLENTN